MYKVTGCTATKTNSVRKSQEGSEQPCRFEAGESIFDERVRDLKLKDLQQDLIDFQITLNSAAILHTIRRATQKDRIHDRVLDDILV